MIRCVPVFPEGSLKKVQLTLPETLASSRTWMFLDVYINNVDNRTGRSSQAVVVAEGREALM